MSTKTQTMNAWLSSGSASHAANVQHLDLDRLIFSATHCDMESAGWVKVGTAEITVTFEPSEAMREKAAARIRQQMQDAAAKYQAMQTELQDRLNKLLAIGYEEQA